MGRPRTRPTTPEAQAKRDRERRYYMLSKRPPEMVERHARELQELKDRQFAETEEWIASHTSKAEQAKERKLAKLKALADELGIALDPPSNGHTPPVEQTPPPSRSCADRGARPTPCAPAFRTARTPWGTHGPAEGALLGMRRLSSHRARRGPLVHSEDALQGAPVLRVHREAQEVRV